MATTEQNVDDLTGRPRTSEFIEQRRADSAPFEEQLWDAVDEIPDPHIPVSLVEMAVIYNIEEDDGHVDIEMTYPCMGCPAYDMIQNDVRSCLRVINGVESVDIEVVWEPVWSKDMLTEAVREKMRESGIGL